MLSSVEYYQTSSTSQKKIFNSGTKLLMLLGLRGVIGRRLYPSLFVQYCAERERPQTERQAWPLMLMSQNLGLKHTELDCCQSISMMEAQELIQSWSSCENGDQITLIHLAIVLLFSWQCPPTIMPIIIYILLNNFHVHMINLVDFSMSQKERPSLSIYISLPHGEEICCLFHLSSS